MLLLHRISLSDFAKTVQAFSYLNYDYLHNFPVNATSFDFNFFIFLKDASDWILVQSGNELPDLT